MEASIIVEKYNLKNNKMAFTKDNLLNKSQEELINIILSLKINNSTNVGDLIINLLKDADFKSASNSDIAAAVQSITGSETSAKSVSSTRSVYNKKILDAAIAKLPALSGKAKAIAIAELEYDLTENNILIASR